MSRDKQIEEMAKAIEEARIKANYTTNSMNYGFGDWFAKELYNAGYRKASDVAREIFEEIQKSIVHNILHNENYSFEGVMDSITKDLDELKKKYTEGE